MRYPKDASLERPPEEYGVDRMEVEVRRRMQLTITNRPKTYPRGLDVGLFNVQFLGFRLLASGESALLTRQVRQNAAIECPQDM